MANPSDLITGAAFRGDFQGSDRVLQGEWVRLLNEAVRSTWNLASAARPDFQFSSYDFTLTSGGSASIAVPSNFHSLIDVVFGPDTTQEYSLGPFAWQNRRSPGGWWPPFLTSGGGPGGTRASLRGDLIYVEPSLRAGGNYRLWFCPKAKDCKWLVRLATTAALSACTAAGSGVGKTLTANVNGALTVDGQTAALNDKILVKNEVTTANNGVYVVTSAGSVSTAWVLTRATDFDATAEVAVGDIVAVGQTNPVLAVGALNEAKFFTVATFTAIEFAVTFTEGANFDAILDPFVELVEIKTAVPAMMRDGGTQTTSVRDFREREQTLTAEMQRYFGMVRSVTVSKIIDTDATGINGFRGGW